MADRLTQLQVCLDQLVEQFNATINYVNTNCEMAMLDEDPNSVINLAINAPLPGQQMANSGNVNNTTNASNANSNHPLVRAEAEQTFENTIDELATDIILKSRQISMLIDSLPGIGVPPKEQLNIIESLSKELEAVEKERIEKIAEKDKLLSHCEALILEVANGIAETRG